MRSAGSEPEILAPQVEGQYGEVKLIPFFPAVVAQGSGCAEAFLSGMKCDPSRLFRSIVKLSIR